ncbi:sarcosine oxidase subunit delta [Salinisphaera aquimarina]|uniref:Sarcosine oxidase subunit delta n=1 Tax=Salinisphaera aquimarina TaxID=2094031 RepID=A0ABV7ETA3_9GAMM
MLQLACPYCGPRPHTEFSYGGDATRSADAASGTGDGFESLYYRDNPKGPHHELWYHRDGCGQWLVAERDTVTHAVQSVTALTESTT